MISHKLSKDQSSSCKKIDSSDLSNACLKILSLKFLIRNFNLQIAYDNKCLPIFFQTLVDPSLVAVVSVEVNSRFLFEETASQNLILTLLKTFSSKFLT